jgi:hypothetical protein
MRTNRRKKAQKKPGHVRHLIKDATRKFSRPDRIANGENGCCCIVVDMASFRAELCNTPLVTFSLFPYRWLFDCFGEAMQLDICQAASFVSIADARVNIPIFRPEHECRLDNGVSVIWRNCQVCPSRPSSNLLHIADLQGFSVFHQEPIKHAYLR